MSSPFEKVQNNVNVLVQLASKHREILLIFLFQGLYMLLFLTAALLVVFYLVAVCREKTVIIKDNKQEIKKMDALSRSEPAPNSQSHEGILYRYYMKNDEERKEFIKDSMLHNAIVQRAKEIEKLAEVRCDCEASVKRCGHNLCRRCCEVKGLCGRRNPHGGVGLLLSSVDSRRPSFMDSQGHVYLANQSLHTIPSGLGLRCQEAKVVDLSYNNFTELPNHMALMRRLWILVLNNNCIHHIPRSFGNFRQLQTLDLGCNAFQGFPENVLELKSLQVLRLDGNHIPSIPCGISNLRSLQLLGMDFNNISEVPASLFTISTLKVLSLTGNCRLRTIPPQLCQAMSLQSLFLAMCRIDFIPASVELCPRLRFLDLSNNRLRYIPAELTQVRHLKILNVRNNYLETIPAPFQDIHYKMSLEAFSIQYPDHDDWEIQTVVPEPAPKKNPLSLSHLAKLAVKRHSIDYSDLPLNLREDLTEMSWCYFCLSKGETQYIRLIKRDRFGWNGPTFPYLYTFCLSHISMGSDDSMVDQLNNMLNARSGH